MIEEKINHLTNSIKKEVPVKKEETKAEKVEAAEEKKAVANDDLANKTVAELRDLAKAKDVKGYSTMKKAELIDALK